MSVKPSTNGGCNGGSCASQGTPDPQDQNIDNALDQVVQAIVDSL